MNKKLFGKNFKLDSSSSGFGNYQDHLKEFTVGKMVFIFKNNSKSFKKKNLSIQTYLRKIAETYQWTNVTKVIFFILIPKPAGGKFFLGLHEPTD